MSGTSILVGLVGSQAGKMCALVSSTTKEDGRREEVVGLVGSQASKMCAVVSTNVVRMPEEVVRRLACGRLLSPHSLNAPSLAAQAAAPAAVHHAEAPRQLCRARHGRRLSTNPNPSPSPSPSPNPSP
jgi:hypothetical protein